MADGEATRVVEDALMAAGLSIKSKTYTSAEAGGGGTFGIVGFVGGDPVLMFDKEGVASVSCVQGLTCRQCFA